LLKVKWFESPTEAEAKALEPLGLIWKPDESGESTPHIRFEADPDRGHYDIGAKHEEAGRRDNPRVSPHTALRAIHSSRDVLRFLADFGPLLNYPPHVIPADPGTKGELQWGGSTLAIPFGSSGWLISLRDFERRQKCYSMALRLYDALHDEDRLRREWRDAALGMQEIVRGGFPPILRNEHVKRWLVEPVNEAFDVSIWELEREFEPSQPTLTDWVAKAPVEELRTLAHDSIVRAVDGNTGERVRWDVRTSEDGRPILRPVVETSSLWAAIWNFFAMDTDNGKLWRLCPHCNKIFSPPRKDRYYCTARLQQLYSKRKWARQHR
jgi:hypothetical protein